MCPENVVRRTESGSLFGVHVRTSRKLRLEKAKAVSCRVNRHKPLPASPAIIYANNFGDIRWIVSVRASLCARANTCYNTYTHTHKYTHTYSREVQEQADIDEKAPLTLLEFEIVSAPVV
jgi:hypothetical protein